MTQAACRFCGAALKLSFADLGMSPPSNSYLEAADLNRMERFYPLHAWVCEKCFLVQLEEFETPEEIFSDYAYFSSYSDSWLAHAKAYTEAMVARFDLGASSFVVEIASNDGYLLQYFVAKGVPVLGIEPAANVAAVAEKKGVPTLVKFFGTKTAAELAAAGRKADLIAGNNVLAHVPDLNDFVRGHERSAQAERRGDDGVPAPAAVDAGEPVRHDLPRAFLLLLLRRRRARVRGARPDAVRCGRDPDARGLAPHLRAATRPMPRCRCRRKSPSCAAASRPRASSAPRPIVRSPSR